VLLAVTSLSLGGCGGFVEHLDKSTYPKGTTGYFINDEFKQLAQRCSLLSSAAAAANKSFIPTDVQGNLLNEYPVVYPSLHPATLFLHPFTEENKKALLSLASESKGCGDDAACDKEGKLDKALLLNIGLSPQDTELLKLGIEQSPRKVAGLGFQSIRKSCATYLNTYLKASVGVSQAELEGTIDAQTERGGRLYMAGGEFVSPFVDMLANEGKLRALFARMLLWQNYTANPDLVKNNLFVLRQFTGLMLARAETSKTDLNTSISGSAGYNAGVGAVEAAAKARYEDNYQYTSEYPLTLVTQISGQGFFRLDDPKQIAASFKNAFAMGASNIQVAEKMFGGKVHRHSFTLEGVPIGVCEQGSWQMVKAPVVTLNGKDQQIYEGGSVKVSAKKGPASDQLPTCEFTIEGTPTDTIVTELGSLQMKYTLQNDKPVKLESGNVALELEVGPLRLNSDPSPRVLAYGRELSPEPTSPDSPTAKHAWMVVFGIQEGANPLAPGEHDKLQPKSVALSCPVSGAIAISPATIQRDTQTGQYTLKIVMNKAVALPGDYKMENCTFSANFDLTLQDGSRVSRSIQTSFLYPIAANAGGADPNKDKRPLDSPPPPPVYADAPPFKAATPPTGISPAKPAKRGDTSAEEFSRRRGAVNTLLEVLRASERSSKP